MWFHRLHSAVLALVLTLLVSCSQTPSVTSASAAGSNGKDTPGQPVAGKAAFWEMYKSAHNWSKELVQLALESTKVTGMKNEGGNAVMWSATFGSPTRREARTFSYSVVGHAPDIYNGVTVGKSIPWCGPTPTSARASVDLPAPLGPMMPRAWPLCSENDTSESSGFSEPGAAT